MPKISVYIPLFNREHSIGKAIEGILQQSYQDFELIIIDDGSTDDSLEVVSKYRDKRIRIFQNKKNRGVVYTRNRAFDLAEGEYLAINDSDDYSLPERFAKQVKILDENKAIGILGGKALKIDHLGNKTIWQYPSDSKNIKCRLFWGSSMINSTLIMRLKMIRDNNLRYNDNFPVAEDYDIFERAQNYFELRNLNDVLIEYSSHPTNLTNSQKELMVKKAYEIHLRQLKKLDICLSTLEMGEWYKLFSYSFNFTYDGLKALFNIGHKILTQNDKLKIYDPVEFNVQLSKRLYECNYHSHVKGSYQMFSKSPFQDYINASRKEKIKFYISQFR